MAQVLGFGQRIETDRPIAGTLPCGSGSDAPATLRVRHLPPRSMDKSAAILALSGTDLVFRPPGVGIYVCTANSVEVTPHPGADPEEIAALLIATALPACLWMQGTFVLHSAVLRIPGSGGAIAFAGASGIGKSAIAAQLVARGASLVADDSVAIVPGESGAVASGLPGGYFANEDESGERRFVTPPPAQTLERSDLAAIVIMSRAPAASTFSRLSSLDALQQLLRHRHRPAIPAILGQHARNFKIATSLATAVPVYSWQRQEGSIAIDDAEWAMLAKVAKGEAMTR